MPTFASQQVSVTSQTLKTTLTLAQLQQLLSARAPKQSTHTPGWRGVTEELQRPTRNGVTTDEAPAIWAEDAAENYPERLMARWVWWTQRVPEDGSELTDVDPWWLDGVDVLIVPAAGAFHLMWSSQDSRLITPPGGVRSPGDAADSLLLAIQSADAQATLTSKSVLSFNPDVFLWLTNAVDKEAKLGRVRISEVSGMSTDEIGGGARARSSVLSGQVDFDRISYVSAIANGVHLGPAAVTFVEPNADGRAEKTTGKLYADGSFKPLIGSCHYRDTPSAFEERLRAVQRIAFRYVPLVQGAFAADDTWGTEKRDMLLVEKQVFLSEEFLRLAKVNPQYGAWVASQEVVAPEVVHSDEY